VSIVEVRGLSKRYDPPKGVLAVDDASFSIERGEIFSLLGPNGAGKSTTIAMLSCLLRPSHGDALVDSHSIIDDPQAVKSIIGVVPQDIAVYPDMTARENLVFWGRMYGLSGAELQTRVGEVLELVSLADRQKDRVDKFSGGMKRRLTIARSLINNPELLLLDEPTTGLDPQARHILWDRLFRLKRQGVILIITTHYMDEAEQLCDRLVVIDQGRIVAEGSPRSLIEQYSTREVLELRFPAGTNDTNAAQLAGIGERQELLPDRVLVYAHDGEAALVEAHARGLQPESALVRRASLEDVFLLLTGRSLAD